MLGMCQVLLIFSHLTLTGNAWIPSRVDSKMPTNSLGGSKGIYQASSLCALETVVLSPFDSPTLSTPFRFCYSYK